MAATNKQHLSQCMRFFKNADPHVYETFMRAMDDYVYELTVAVTETDTAEILVAKGRAQTARKFQQLFSELPAEPPSP